MSEEEEEGKREGALGGFGGGSTAIWFLRWGMLGAFSAGLGDRQLRHVQDPATVIMNETNLVYSRRNEDCLQGVHVHIPNLNVFSFFLSFFLSLTRTAIPNN